MIRYPWQFLAVRALNPGRRLQAGEYQFTRADTPSHVFDRIARGDVFFYELTVPEGSNMFDIAANLGRFDFLTARRLPEAARDPSLIRDLGPERPDARRLPVPVHLSHHAPHHCGAALPDDDGLVPQALARTAESRRPGFGERHRDAGVAGGERDGGSEPNGRWSRRCMKTGCERGMALDCDPTTIYAALLDERYRGTIYRSDLDSTNAYNTYQHAGLPPGPIANPGPGVAEGRARVRRKPIICISSPSPDGSGSHQFSKTIEEHNRAVQKYRRANKQPAAVEAPPRAHSRGRHHHRKG